MCYQYLKRSCWWERWAGAIFTSLGGKDSLIFTLCHLDFWNVKTILVKIKKKNCLNYKSVQSAFLLTFQVNFYSIPGIQFALVEDLLWFAKNIEGTPLKKSILSQMQVNHALTLKNRVEEINICSEKIYTNKRSQSNSWLKISSGKLF